MEPVKIKIDSKSLTPHQDAIRAAIEMLRTKSIIEREKGGIEGAYARISVALVSACAMAVASEIDAGLKQVELMPCIVDAISDVLSLMSLDEADRDMSFTYAPSEPGHG